MMGIRINTWTRALLLMFFIGTTLELTSSIAEARAGRGRSSGRSSNYGSRQTPPPQRQSPPPASNPGLNNSGGFMRGLAGGIAGGFLGSMLFSSLGNAAGATGAGAGGGMGPLEIALLAGLAFFGYKWWKNRRQTAVAYAPGNTSPQNYISDSGTQWGDNSFQQHSTLAPVSIGTEDASDIFFKIQGAWTRRDLTSVSNILGREMQETLGHDLNELKKNQQINRLENISVRRTEVINSWQEDGSEYSTVRFAANLLDYTVDEKNGQVIEGNDTQPVKFEEDWTFVKDSRSHDWQLAGIQQVH